MNPRMEFLKNKTSNLTSSPGVYLMKNVKNHVIYVGKAKNLLNRVSTYFFSNDHLPKVEKMINDVYDFDFIVTESEYEALILECNFIKQYHPQYNILLMDDKSYSYICISKSEYPRLCIKKNKDNKGTYFGPYVSGSYAKLLMNEANDIFKLPTCKRNFSNNKLRPCLRYHMGKCLGYCSYYKSKDEYDKIINDVISFFEKGYKSTLENLHKEMEDCAKNLYFERAIYLRDRLKAIDTIQNKQIVINSYYYNCDIIAIAKSSDEICVSILIYRNGNIFDKASYFFDSDDYTENFWETFFVQHYLNYKNIPDKIIIQPDFDGSIFLLIDFFNKYFEKDVKFIAAKSGLSKDLHDFAMKNAVEQITVKQEKNTRNTDVLSSISKLLNLDCIPNYIESYDISNMSDATIVAGMVVFENGLPLKKAYKHFNLPNNQGQNDFQCMYNTLSRRLSHINNDEKDIYFNKKPDLILIDGGALQLKFVCKAMEEAKIEIPVFGMVKDSRHRTRALIDPNSNEISISKEKKIFDFFTNIQDEVHRYSITYMRKKNNRLYHSDLLKVKGIGKVKLSILLKKYKTIKEMKKASKAELIDLLSISSETADELIKAINNL